MVTIEAIWLRIRLHEGSTFRTVSGVEFAYEVDGNRLRTTSKAPGWIDKDSFGAVLSRVPASGPSDLGAVVYGPSYVWGILHDKRIRGADY